MEQQKDIEDAINDGIAINDVYLKIRKPEELSDYRDISIEGEIYANLKICTKQKIIKPAVSISIPDILLQYISTNLGINIIMESDKSSISIDENIVLYGL
jgi:hypothetical protein